MASQYLQNLPSRAYFMSCIPDLVFSPNHQDVGAGQFLRDLPSRGYLSSTYIPMSNLKAPGRKNVRKYLCDHETAPPQEQHIGSEPDDCLFRAWKKGKIAFDQAMKVAAEKAREERLKRKAERIKKTILKGKAGQRGKSDHEGKKIDKGTSACLAEHISKTKVMGSTLKARHGGTDKRPAEGTPLEKAPTKRLNVGRGDASSKSEAEMLRSRLSADKELRSWAKQHLMEVLQERGQSSTGTGIRSRTRTLEEVVARGDASSKSEAEVLRSRFLADKELQSWAKQYLKELLQERGQSSMSTGTRTREEMVSRAKKLTKEAIIARLKKST